MQLFAPFSVGVNKRGDLAVKANTAEAGLYDDDNKKWGDDLSGFKNAFRTSILSVNGTSSSPETKIATVDFHLKLDTGLSEGSDATDIWNRTRIGFGDNIFVLVIKDKDGKSGYYDLQRELLEIPPCKSCSKKDKKIGEIWGDISLPVSVGTDFSISKNISPIGENGLSELAADSTYTATFYYYANQGGLMYSTAATNSGEDILNNGKKVYFPIRQKSFNTATTEQGITGDIGSGNISVTEGAGSELPVCSIEPWNFHLGGCIAQLFYYMFFKTTSFVFGLAGEIMDFTMMYSISDSSYRSNFVAEGWQVTRDLCNMFFIFILLYIAFKTILGIDSAKTKSLIINVVAVGLLINFSLFVTHVVIDASNILARVFYNNSVLVTGTKDGSGTIRSEKGEFGELKLSEAIVTLVNPTKLISQASEVGKIPSKTGGSVSGEDTEDLSAGNFIIVIILATAINIVGLIAFLSIAFALVGRVITLWIAMILAPIAFFSYTVPKLQGLPMVGSKNWWSDLLSAAFMAPVFAFFMYIIIGFMEKGLGLSDILNKNVKGLAFVVAITIPFILIMILLNKAKEISVKMSGMAGQMLAKAGSSIGGKVAGLGLAAVTGGAAFAMRSTVGRFGASIADSEKLKDAEKKGGVGGFAAKTLRKFGSATGKAGFDFRNTKLGATANGAMSKEMGIDMGKGKTGGYQGFQDNIIKKQTARADTLKMSANEAAKQDQAAKEYKKKYEEAMYAERLKVEKKGGTFNEKDFSDKYDKGGVDSEGKTIEAHGPKVKTADEIHKERIRKLAESKSRDGVFGANADTEAAIIKDLKAKGKEEKKDVTAYDKYKASKKIDNADSVIAKAEKVKQAVEKELGEINKTLEDVARGLGGGLTYKDIKPEHIEKSVKNKQNLIVGYEANIAKYQSQLNDPAHPNASRDLTRNLGYKKKAENEINKYNSIIDRKEKANEKIEKQDETITNQNNIKSEQEDIKAGK